MSPYWLIPIIALLAGTGFVGERYGEDRIKVQCDKRDEAQQQVTINAEESARATETKDTSIISNGVTQYENENGAINHAYGMQPAISPASNSLPEISRTTGGVAPACTCTTRSQVYGLGFKQCDRVQNGLNTCMAAWKAISQ